MVLWLNYVYAVHAQRPAPSASCIYYKAPAHNYRDTAPG